MENGLGRYRSGEQFLADLSEDKAEQNNLAEKFQAEQDQKT